MALMADELPPKAVITMTSSSGCSRLILDSTASPSSSSSLTSIITRLGRFLAMASIAWVPVFALVTR